jgi:AGZA family xanthine/uracil permease-like MFS transporter
MLEKYFNYKKHKTNFKTEVLAGVTTFLTMAYIMFLNPFILSGEFAGQKKVSLVLGQCLPQQLLRLQLLKN